MSKAAVQAAGSRQAVQRKYTAGSPTDVCKFTQALPPSRVQQMQRLHQCCNHPWQQQRAAATLWTKQCHQHPPWPLQWRRRWVPPPAWPAAPSARRRPWPQPPPPAGGGEGGKPAGLVSRESRAVVVRQQGRPGIRQLHCTALELRKCNTHAQLQPFLARCITIAQARNYRAALQYLPASTAHNPLLVCTCSSLLFSPPASSVQLVLLASAAASRFSTADSLERSSPHWSW